MVPFSVVFILHSALALMPVLTLNSALHYLLHLALEHLLTYVACRLWRYWRSWAHRTQSGVIAGQLQQSPTLLWSISGS